MIINDFNVVASIGLPDKADPPLVVDANAVLAFPVSRDRFKSIAWGNPQILNILGGVQHAQLATHYGLKIAGRSPDHAAVPDGFRLRILECPDHGPYYNAPRYRRSRITRLAL